MIDNIIKKLAAKYELDEDVIEKVIRSQFNFVASTMQEGEFQSVHLHYFGKFAVRPNSIKRATEIKAIKDKRNAEQANSNI